MTPQPLLESVATRYRGCGRFAFHYVRGKLRHDPLTAALLTLARAEPLGQVTDLGCGRGQFAALLLQAGLAESVCGLERRTALLDQARRAMRDLAFVGRTRDFLIDSVVPAADTVLLFDVLYQLDDDAQHRLLRSAATAARRRMLIRTADPHRHWRTLLTRLLERAGRRVWPHAGRQVNALPVPIIAAALRDCGFVVRVEPCWAGTPFSNVLLVAEAKKRRHDQVAPPNLSAPVA